MACPPHTQHSVNFRQRLTIVRDMLQYMIGYYQIERLITEWYGEHVYPHHIGSGRKKIRLDVSRKLRVLQK